MSNAQYSVQRSLKNSLNLFGSVHLSESGHDTLCGLELDNGWWILTNNHIGDPSCKRCLALDKSLDDRRLFEDIEV